MIITRTPLRISFLGGGTDFPDFYNKYPGACLSSAIDKYIYVVCKARFDGKIVLHYSTTETVDTLDEIQHELIRESLRKAGIEKGIEVLTMADIPSEGTGLGSSSSLTVGLLHAFYAHMGLSTTQDKLAEDACDIELNIIGRDYGKQDQYIAAFGGFRLITFQASGILSQFIKRSVRKQAQDKFMLFYTGITRRGSNILAEQKEKISQNEELLKKMTKLCLLGHVDLMRGLFYDLGKLIDESWKVKKQFADGVSNDVIDGMYQKAKMAGAIGCKVCGAGGGGFLLVCCDEQAKGDIRHALRDFRELPFKFEPEGSKVILKEG